MHAHQTEINDPTRRYWCVLTGDIVGSTGLQKATRRRLHETMRKAGKALQRVLGPEAMPRPVDIFGGDGWQALLWHPKDGLRSALLYRSLIIAGVKPDARRDVVDTRCVVARAPIDFVPGGDVSEGEGEAFRLSGRTLQKLGASGSDRRLVFVNAGQSQLGDWDTAFRLLDELVKGWTALQARAVAGALSGLTQEQIALQWVDGTQIRQASVAGHLDAAHWDAVYHAVEAFESRFRPSQEKL